MQVKMLNVPFSMLNAKEKVYSVSETPTQHTCGVSKTNEKLTNILKITTHQLRLHKKKRHKYPLIFPHPTTLPFPLLQNKKFHLSLSLSLCFFRSTVPHQSPLTSTAINLPSLNSKP